MFFFPPPILFLQQSILSELGVCWLVKVKKISDLFFLKCDIFKGLYAKVFGGFLMFLFFFMPPTATLRRILPQFLRVSLEEELKVTTTLTFFSLFFYPTISLLARKRHQKSGVFLSDICLFFCKKSVVSPEECLVACLDLMTDWKIFEVFMKLSREIPREFWFLIFLIESTMLAVCSTFMRCFATPWMCAHKIHCDMLALMHKEKVCWPLASEAFSFCHHCFGVLCAHGKKKASREALWAVVWFRAHKIIAFVWYLRN